MEVNGKGIAVDIFGDGAPILMIHGLGGTSNVWYAQREVLARSFRVICPDLEGSGRSPLKGELSIDGFVADMAALLDILNISSAHVVGYSLGRFACNPMWRESHHAKDSLSEKLLSPHAQRSCKCD